MFHVRKSQDRIALAEVRARITGPVKPESETYRDCSQAYGRRPSGETWRKWRRKVLASLDRDFLPPGEDSYASYVALMVVAFHLRGNEPSDKGRKVGRARLARILETVSASDIEDWRSLPRLLPSQLSLGELDNLIAEIVPAPSRTTQWRAGVVRGQGRYDSWQVNQILRKLNHAEFTVQSKAS